MLKAVIKKKHVDGSLGLYTPALCEAIPANPKGGAPLEAKFHQLDFITCAIRAVIAAAENGHALSVGKKLLGNPNHHWCFAGTANGQISDAHHGRFQPLLLHQTFGIEPGTQPNDCAIE